VADSPPGRAAREWIADQLDRIGSRPVGPSDEPRIRPWSTVVRIPTDNGPVWFKANHAQTTYEPALMRELVRHAPDLVLAPIATDFERGWSLLPDGGPILRSFPDDTVLRDWERILPAYAELQQALSRRTAELIAVGVPDDRPATMPELLAALLEKTDVLLVDEPDGLSTEELARLRELGPDFAAQCDLLDGSGIAASVEHSDLHDGNIFVRGGRYAVFDWGDTSIAHPFGSLLVAMSAIRARYDMAADAPALARLRDAYLEPWTPGHTRRELVELAAIATAVAPLSRARSWERALSDVPPADRGPYREAVPGWLHELLIKLAGQAQPSP
jgi:hypothetical protein